MANTERVQLFTAALRSGRFTQGTGRLTDLPGTDDERHCCLGVACIIAMENGLELNYDDSSGQRLYLRDGSDADPSREDDYNNGEVLSRAVSEWYGFVGSDPELRAQVDGHMRRYWPATTLNDEQCFTFDQIADAFDNTFVHPVEGDASEVAA
jgi:hypothetical protein